MAASDAFLCVELPRGLPAPRAQQFGDAAARAQMAFAFSVPSRVAPQSIVVVGAGHVGVPHAVTIARKCTLLRHNPLLSVLLLPLGG